MNKCTLHNNGYKQLRKFPNCHSQTVSDKGQYIIINCDGRIFREARTGIKPLYKYTNK